MTSWSTVFMGTPDLAVPVLRRLAERSDCRLVVTQPDAPAGRGRQLRPPPVKVAATELGLPVWQPDGLRDRASDPRLQDIDFFIVLAYGEILRQDILDLPRQDCINLHASLLPRWRGASPLQAAIRAGDRRSGISVMSMVRALDAGPVYLQEAVDLPERVTLPWLHDRLAETAVIALDRLLDAWPLPAVPQDPAEVTVCGKLATADGRIDWQQSAEAIDAQVRAYTPVPGCWTTAAGERYRIRAGEPADGVPGLAAGVVQADAGVLLVGTGSGCYRVDDLQPPGKRAMTASAFLNGHRPPDTFL